MKATVNWPSYLRIISDGAINASIAKTTGIGETTIHRWMNGTPPKPRQVVDVARAYGVDPLEALIAADYLSEGDVERVAAAPRALQIREFTEIELALEIVRRAVLGSSELLQAPLDSNHPAMQQFSDPS